MVEIGRRLRKLSNKIGRGIINCKSLKAMNEFSGVNGFMLLFIRNKNGVFQKDLENEFGITRSTASKIVSLMEKKDLLIRTSDELDKRAKKIVLTQKAEEICLQIQSEISEYENNLISGLNEKEVNTLMLLLDKVEKNIEYIEVQND